VVVGMALAMSLAMLGCDAAGTGADAVNPGADAGDVSVAGDSQDPDPGSQSEVLPGHCGNGLLDGDETDQDCGGSCEGCTFKQKCSGAQDCATNWCVEGKCNVPTCSDNLLGPSEVDLDCGNTCPPCGDGLKCNAMSDCKSGICVLGNCLAPTCGDLHINGNESDRDCGGDKCLPCGNGQICGGPTDCSSGRCVSDKCVACARAADCPGDDKPCYVRTCTDGVCGHATIAEGDPSAAQAVGDCKAILCLADGTTNEVNDDTDVLDDKNDCTVDLCSAGAPPATPTFLETGSPCTTGGKVCNASGVCVACMVDEDCASQVCLVASGKCGAATCLDGKKNGNETGKDCGGACGKCPAGEPCKADTDCLDAFCEALVCVGPACNDLRQNGDETAVDCGGLLCGGCGLGEHCLKHTDCGSGHCSAAACVECILPTDCPGNDDECTSRTCDYSNMCGTSNALFGTIPTTQLPGDCKKIICSGDGGTDLLVANTDVPNDNRQCTQDLCTNGVPSNIPEMPGTPCTEDGGTVCDSTGNCIVP
jgi:hypothetical protein